MATGAPISVEEYLATAWHPDCDFIDGEVRERTIGEFSHGRMQVNIGVWLRAREKEWRFLAVPEVRLQLSTSTFRIPDLMLIASDAPREEIVRTAPWCVLRSSRAATLCVTCAT